MEFNPMDLINLRELQLQYVGKGINRFTLDSIGGLRSLQSLDIDVLTEDQLGFPRSICTRSLAANTSSKLRLGDWSLVDWKLPTEVLPNLKYLCLQASGLTEDPMPMLEKLPELTVLLLDSYLGKKLVCTAGEFPQLEILQLTNASLKEIQVGRGGMPVLKGLLIVVSRYVSMPDRQRSILAPDPGISWSKWGY
ncbi:inactive disease susceptibility protein LOV1-like [Rhododendron vialii]|uniref:inactive disease susceptibility protein LOV1-like n=1 Tax=Rhododendron vialii TaxID=182163 RepID=UPI00265DC444|nr:inactive disease susceptibility protein LOV1-like [Rhododendron vialii]XP_058184261.1 inactive disease susceptibility protein LOV1-like [Rhododendron vialii]